MRPSDASPSAWMPSSLVSRMRMNSFRFDPDETSHVRAQHFRNGYAAALVLIVFDDGNERATDGGARSVEGVDETVAVAVLVVVAGLHVPPLELPAGARGRS